MLIWTLIVWLVIVVGFVVADTEQHYYVLSGVVGLVIGSTPALGRAVLAVLVEREHAAEIFGFNAFGNRVSSVLGPILFGVIASTTGNQRIAVLSLLVFFGAGLWILANVKIPREADA